MPKMKHKIKKLDYSARHFHSVGIFSRSSSSFHYSVHIFFVHLRFIPCTSAFLFRRRSCNCSTCSFLFSISLPRHLFLSRSLSASCAIFTSVFSSLISGIRLVNKRFRRVCELKKKQKLESAFLCYFIISNVVFRNFLDYIIGLLIFFRKLTIFIDWNLKFNVK